MQNVIDDIKILCNNNNEENDDNINIELNNEIKQKFMNIIDENIINNSKNMDDLFHKLSNEISNNQNNILYIKYLLLLFPEFFQYNNNNEKFSLTFFYLSRILAIIQNNIEKININFIIKIFNNIVIKFSDKNNEILIKNYNNNPNNKNIYEIFQGFCIYNMKMNNDINQKFGVISLTILINNLNYFINDMKYIKYLFEQIILFLENENYLFKFELLICLKIFIEKIKFNFKEHTILTLYKIIDYLNNNDNEIKKITLEIINLLIKYDYNNILELKGYLI